MARGKCVHVRRRDEQTERPECNAGEAGDLLKGKLSGLFGGSK